MKWKLSNLLERNGAILAWKQWMFWRDEVFLGVKKIRLKNFLVAKYKQEVAERNKLIADLNAKIVLQDGLKAIALKEKDSQIAELQKKVVKLTNENVTSKERLKQLFEKVDTMACKSFQKSFKNHFSQNSFKNFLFSIGKGILRILG